MKQLLMLFIAVNFLSACNSEANKAAIVQAARQKTIDSLNVVLAKQKLIDSMRQVNAKNEKRNTHTVETVTMEHSTAEPAKKKGLNHTAKGALVGAGTGAVTGAIINHNDRVKGAAVGTVLGTGIGAVTGLIVDKSVKKKKKKASNQNNQ